MPCNVTNTQPLALEDESLNRFSRQREGERKRTNVERCAYSTYQVSRKNAFSRATISVVRAIENRLGNFHPTRLAYSSYWVLLYLFSSSVLAFCPVMFGPFFHKSYWANVPYNFGQSGLIHPLVINAWPDCGFKYQWLTLHVLPRILLQLLLRGQSRNCQYVCTSDHILLSFFFFFFFHFQRRAHVLFRIKGKC